MRSNTLWRLLGCAGLAFGLWAVTPLSAEEEDAPRGKQDKGHTVTIDLDELPPGLAKQLVHRAEEQHASKRLQRPTDDAAPKGKKGKGPKGPGKHDEKKSAKFPKEKGYRAPHDDSPTFVVMKLPSDVAHRLLEMLEDRMEAHKGPPAMKAPKEPPRKPGKKGKKPKDE